MPFFTATDGTQLYYVDEGAGPPVVLIHGWGSDLNYYNGLAAALSATCRCIRYDQRGHGRSQVPFAGQTVRELGGDLRQAVQTLGLQDVTVVGHSMGALAIYDYISRWGDRNLSSLAVMDMSPKPLADAEWPLGACSLALDHTTWLGEMEGAAQFSTAIGWSAVRPAIPLLVTPLACWESLLPSPPGTRHPATLTALWASMCDSDYRGALGSVTVPAAYLRPEKALYPAAVGDYFVQQVSGPAFAETIPNTDHYTVGQAVHPLAAALNRLRGMAAAQRDQVG